MGIRVKVKYYQILNMTFVSSHRYDILKCIRVIGFSKNSERAFEEGQKFTTWTSPKVVLSMFD